jgi:hypothetical protein
MEKKTDKHLVCRDACLALVFWVSVG